MSPFSFQNKVLTIDGVKVKLQVRNVAPIKGSRGNLLVSLDCLVPLKAGTQRRARRRRYCLYRDVAEANELISLAAALRSHVRGRALSRATLFLGSFRTCWRKYRGVGRV